MMLEVWGPRFGQPWGNCFGGVDPARVRVPDEGGTRQAPTDVIVNGRAEFRPAGQGPTLQPGDVLFNPLSEATFRVPLENTPAWHVERRLEGARSDWLSLLERQANLAQLDLSAPRAQALLGASRAWLLGSLRCEWHRGFVVGARWSSAGTVRDSMAWHLWQLLTSPAGFGLEHFSGTPVDVDDLQATREVVAAFPAPRLREVVFETNEPFDAEHLSGTRLRRAPLPWLRVDARGEPSAHVTVGGSSQRPRVAWRQLVEVRVNEQTPNDRCLWHEGLWVELRAGDVVTWPGGGLHVSGP